MHNPLMLAKILADVVLKVNVDPRTSGGLSTYKLVSAASTNAQSVKGSAGMLYAFQVFNVNAEERWLKLYDKASAPTVGTDVPKKTIMIPGSTTGAGAVFGWDIGIEFLLGIAIAITTGPTDADTGAVAASDILINLDYK